MGSLLRTFPVQRVNEPDRLDRSIIHVHRNRRAVALQGWIQPSERIGKDEGQRNGERALEQMAIQA